VITQGMTREALDSVVSASKDFREAQCKTKPLYVIQNRKGQSGAWIGRFLPSSAIPEPTQVQVTLPEWRDLASNLPKNSTDIPVPDAMAEFSRNVSIVFGVTKDLTSQESMSDLESIQTDPCSAAFESASSNLGTHEAFSAVSSRSRSSFVTARSGLSHDARSNPKRLVPK
jgi:hypothetical protein